MGTTLFQDHCQITNAGNFPSLAGFARYPCTCEAKLSTFTVWLKPGDVIVIPAGVGHQFTRIDDHIRYLMIRVDPDKVTPLKDEAASRADIRSGFAPNTKGAAKGK